jgi:PAS domain S-box-containing protein
MRFVRELFRFKWFGVRRRQPAGGLLDAGEEDKLRALLESASQGVLAVDSRGVILMVNAKTEELFGYRREELLGTTLEVLLPAGLRHAHVEQRSEFFRNPRKRPMGLGLELAGRKKDGTEFPLEVSLSYVRDAGGTTALALITDITYRKRNEEHLREVAKLESLGVLAGGIAHDFNNLLVGVMGNASLALDEIPAGSPARSMIQGVIDASERAANLVRQLLAYSGRGRFTIGPVDLSRLIVESKNLIRASIPKTAELRFELAEGAPAVEGDASQLQQVVMNLAVNGGEALGERPGTVVLRTAAERDQRGCELVRLEVEDDGCGMDAATREKIFDPFFTTKFTGRGLGLAAVHGIVRAHKGTVEVSTTPGQGSKFTVRFPAGRRAGPRPGGDAKAESPGDILVGDCGPGQ